MRDFLKENFEIDPSLPKRITQNVLKKAKIRRKRQKITYITISTLSLFILLLLTFNLQRFETTNSISQTNISHKVEENSMLNSGQNLLISQNQENLKNHSKERVITQSPNNLSTSSIEPKDPFPIKLNKFDSTVEISWDREGEYVIYKCESPLFDKCTQVEIVKGNKYLDKSNNSAKIVFYRVEPLKKG